MNKLKKELLSVVQFCNGGLLLYGLDDFKRCFKIAPIQALGELMALFLLCSSLFALQPIIYLLVLASALVDYIKSSI